MKSAVRRAMSCGLALRPSSSSPRSISLRAPAPIRLRAVSRGTGGKPSRSSTKLSALIRSGAVSTSVPARSNTMGGAEAIREALSVSVRSCKMGMLDFCGETADLKPADLGERMREFSGKTAFVTGGGSGIGLAPGPPLRAAGMNVMLADVERSALDSAVNSLQHYGARVRGVSCDVTDAGSVDAAAKAAFDAFGHVHVVCNNAGVAAGGGIDDISLDNWRWVIDVNLMGGLHGIRSFLPHIRAHGEGGHIVNTASMAGMESGLGFSPYAASKVAVVAMSEGLAMQIKPFGIGVSVLCPGYVRTRIGESGRNRPERYGPAPTLDPASPAGALVAQIAKLLQAGLDP